MIYPAISSRPIRTLTLRVVNAARPCPHPCALICATIARRAATSARGF
jgi:hypothetical protein